MKNVFTPPTKKIKKNYEIWKASLNRYDRDLHQYLFILIK